MVPVKIICVLKSSEKPSNKWGSYDPSYVDKLFNSIQRNTTIPFQFICLSDLQWAAPYEINSLTDNLPGWWSKIEMFKYSGAVITLDLDILIVKNIDKLLSLPSQKNNNKIYLMKALYESRRFTTSLMAWNGNFNYIFNEFIFKKDEAFNWDQHYILSKLKEKQIIAIQESVDGIYSYKKQWENQSDTRIIWFHGKPRMPDCEDKILKEHWR